MKNDIPSFLLERNRESAVRPAKRRFSFIDKGIARIADIIRTTYSQWEGTGRNGLLQRTDPRVKLIFLLVFAVIVNLKQTLLPELLLASLLFVLAVLSRLELVSFYKRIILFGFLFGFLLAVPSSINAVSPGEVIVPLFKFNREHTVWIYHLPQTIGITREGIIRTLMLSSRVINSVTLSLLVLSTTPIAEIMRAMKSFRVPDSVLLIIPLAYKYIFIFSHMIGDMYLSIKSRSVGMNTDEAGRWAAGRIAFLFRKVRMRYDEVFTAMQARGLSEGIGISGLGRLKAADFMAGAFCSILGLCLILVR